MDFVRSIAAQVTVLHEGQRAGRGHAWTKCRTIRSVIEVYLGVADDAAAKLERRVNQFYGRATRCGTSTLTVPAGLRARASWAATAWARPRCCEAIMGLLPCERQHPLRRPRARRADRQRARARVGIGYVPQGREIFAQLTVEENLQSRRARRAATASTRSRSGVFELFPVLQDDAAPARRRPLGRPAAAARASGARSRSSPKLLLLDEPTEGIQPNIVHEIGDRDPQALRGRAGLRSSSSSRSSPSRAGSPSASS